MYKVTQEQVESWVTANFPDYKPRKEGSEFVICNPFDGDTGFHMNVSCRGVHDWRSDSWSGSHKPSFLRFVQLYRKCTYAQAIQEVCGNGISLKAIEIELRRSRIKNDKVEEEPEEQVLELPFGCQKLIGSSHPKMASMLLGWLASRGLDAGRVEQLNLHHLADTVIWPYYEYGLLVYWQSRNRVNKVFNFPSENTGVGKTMFLYGFDNAEPNDYVTITEALFGAHTLDAQALASGGAVLESKQIRKIRVLNPIRGVILSPDNDKAGLASIPANYNLIKPYFPVLHSIPPRIEYLDGGEKKYTKDFNELYTGPGFTLKQIRTLWEERVTRTSVSQLSALMSGIIPTT